MKLQAIEHSTSDRLTLRGWQTQQRHLPLLVFLHGNGFCSGVYMPMHRYLAEYFDLLMLDVPGHGMSDSLNPKPGWNSTADIMHRAVFEIHPHGNRPVYVLGHSLGAVFALLNASRHRQSYNSLVLLDPVLFPRTMLLSMRVLSLLGLTSRMHPLVRPTLRRKKTWDNTSQALQYLGERSMYRGWSEDALQCFVEHALGTTGDGTVELRCDPGLEAHYFATLPDRLWASIKNLPCQTSILMGENTYPFALKAANTAIAMNKNISLEYMPGGHCFMLEQPEKAALKIIDLLSSAKPQG